MTESPETRHSLLARLRDARLRELRHRDGGSSGSSTNDSSANSSTSRTSDDERDWREFVEIYEPVVYGLARKSGMQDADARDLTQTVLASVCKSIDRWTPDPARGRFRAWLYRIAKNATINALSRTNSTPRGAGDTRTLELLAQQPASEPASDVAYRGEYRRQAFRWAAKRTRAQVSDSTWRAFWRTSVESASIESVAQELGVTVGVVYAARSRVLARLKAMVQELDLEEDGDVPSEHVR